MELTDKDKQHLRVYLTQGKHLSIMLGSLGLTGVEKSAVRRLIRKKIIRVTKYHKIRERYRVKFNEYYFAENLTYTEFKTITKIQIKIGESLC